MRVIYQSIINVKSSSLYWYNQNIKHLMLVFSEILSILYWNLKFYERVHIFLFPAFYMEFSQTRLKTL